jgi:hypothetical protein
MAIANYFYHKTSRKYVALFGTYFNQLTIERTGKQDEFIQRMIVPISYGPWQKTIARITQDPEFEKKSSLQLPRMSFEMTGMTYDPERKTTTTGKLNKKTPSTDKTSKDFIYAGTPYNLEFSLYVMTKYTEDVSKLIEQIIPFFNPELTNSVEIIDDIDPIDIPLILQGVTTEEVYEGSYEERQTHLATLNFTMKAWFFGPEKAKKVIKFVEVKAATGLDEEFQLTQTTQPGLTEDGEPTTDINETIDFSLIDFSDDWDFIKVVTE